MTEEYIRDFIRREFDKKYNPTWYTKIAFNPNELIESMIVDSIKGLGHNHIYFSVGQFYILLFKPNEEFRRAYSYMV